ncbi:HAD family hydrolase [uncultured Enterovirga sp.]|uniref:HAD family hydrolase n=1 Tax=uncultured Enterovirga sp. TaxID=2026352 RepID=UPI0035CB8337
MSLPPIVVFDLDGTLADTAPDLISTLNVIMDREGLPHVPFETAREMIGAGSRALVERGFEAAGREMTPAHSDELFRLFLTIYADRLCVESRLFPHVEEALATLADRGYRLAVCTNKVELHSRRLLEGLGIAGRFAAICGRDTFPWFKPDARHLTMTIEAAGGDPNRAVMIGDSRTDIDTAKAAGIPVIAVPFGYTDTPVSELGPDIVIDDFDELAAAVERLPGHGRVVGATGIEPVTLRV